MSIAFNRLAANEQLWYGSPSLLRRRFAALLAALGLVGADGVAPYNLSSLRPGGATFWLEVTEDPDLLAGDLLHDISDQAHPVEKPN